MSSPSKCTCDLQPRGQIKDTGFLQGTGSLQFEIKLVKCPLCKAAPGLLKALKGLIATVEASDNDDALVKAAIAVIAKAEGR